MGIVQIIKVVVEIAQNQIEVVDTYLMEVGINQVEVEIILVEDTSQVDPFQVDLMEEENLLVTSCLQLQLF